MEFWKSGTPGPAQPTRLIMETSNAIEAPFIVLQFGPVSSHRICADKGQTSRRAHEDALSACLAERDDPPSRLAVTRPGRLSSLTRVLARRALTYQEAARQRTPP